MANSTDIQNLYIAYFNRPADVAGLAYWTSGSRVNYSAAQIAQLFSQQPEYAKAFANFTTAQTVNALYKNLFNHDADSAGLAYWVGQINNGSFTIGQVAIAILSGATGADADAVVAKFSAASAFTSKMVTNTSAQTAYSADNSNNAFGIAKLWLAGVVDASSSASANKMLEATFAAMTKAPVVTLTVNPGVTNLGTTGDDAFTVTDEDLLMSGTSIIGNGGTDVLNVTTRIKSVAHPANVSGVSTLNLQKGGDLGDVGAAFINQFTTINDYGTFQDDQLYLGTIAQTVNLYNTFGDQYVDLHAPNQTVNQIVTSSGSVSIYANNANLAAASINLNKATNNNNYIKILDTGVATLSQAQLRNINSVDLYESEDLTLSPTADIRVNTFGAKTTLISSTNKQITVWQNAFRNQTLNLDGTANYIVQPSDNGSITDTGTAGALKVLGYSSYEAITSSVATIIETTDRSSYSLNGTGSFNVTNLGQFSNSIVFDGSALNGIVTVNTIGENNAAFYEADGNGAVTVNLSGAGLLSLRATLSHSTIVNAIEGVNATLDLSGAGNLTINAAARSNLTITGSAGQTTINLEASGGGFDQINIVNSTLYYIKNGLVTINNFKASGADVLHTRLKASSMGVINIDASDFNNLASNIASNAGILQIGNAFIVKVAAGAAAGSYVYEHMTGTTVNVQDIIVKLTGTIGNITAGDLLY